MNKEPHARLPRAGPRGREGDPIYAIGGCFPVLGPPVCLLNITAFGDWLASSVHTACAIPCPSIATEMKSSRFRLPPKMLQFKPWLQMSPRCMTFVLICPFDHTGEVAYALRD